MVTLNLKLSRKDIAAGVPNDSLECPVAHLFNRVIGKGITADVEGNIVTFHHQDGNLVAAAKLPKEVTAFITDFDELSYEQVDVKPISFNLRLTNTAAKALNIRKRYLPQVA